MNSFNIKTISFVIILAGIVLSCFLLGIWQTNRYFQKQFQFDNQPIIHQIKAVDLITTEDKNHLINKSVMVTGKFIENSIFKLDNRMFNSKYGVDIFALFKIENSEKTYLINMGWLEVGSAREKLALKFDFSNIYKLTVKIENIPSKPPFINVNNFQDDIQKDLWIFINRDFLQKKYSIAIENVALINQAPEDPLQYRTIEIENNAIMHVFYAVQWFLFSLFALIGLLKVKK